MKPWYETLFSNFGRKYENESFTQGTMGEVDFIVHEIAHDSKVHILDVGCGTGRHAVELASRGFMVTGVDLSESMLRQARAKASERGVDVRFQRADARSLPFEQEFDLVIMLCEGAFSLMETDEMNYAILRGVYQALRSPGKLIMTTLNGLYPLLRGETIPGDKTKLKTGDHAHFDLMTFREHAEMIFEDDDNQEFSVTSSERYYTPIEMQWLLRTAGFTGVEIFGCTLGAYSRGDILGPDDYEMLIVATVGSQQEG